MARVVIAVIAGFVLWSVLWVVAGQVVLAINPAAYGEDGRTAESGAILLLFIMVALVISVVSGWLTALVGRDGGRRAAMILAVILLAVGLTVEILGWQYAPVWYHLIFLGLLIPATVSGAMLKK